MQSSVHELTGAWFTHCTLFPCGGYNNCCTTCPLVYKQIAAHAHPHAPDKQIRSMCNDQRMNTNTQVQFGKVVNGTFFFHWLRCWCLFFFWKGDSEWQWISLSSWSTGVCSSVHPQCFCQLSGKKSAQQNEFLSWRRLAGNWIWWVLICVSATKTKEEARKERTKTRGCGLFALDKVDWRDVERQKWQFMMKK